MPIPICYPSFSTACRCHIRGMEEIFSSGSCWTEYSNKLFFRMNEEMIQI